MNRSSEKELALRLMPSGILTPYDMPPRPPTNRPGLLLRARVWFKRLELDARLADGADPANSEQLALRAKQLARREKREKLAGSIERLVEVAEGQGRAGLVIPYPPFRWKQIRDSRSLLRELAERLQSRRPVAVRGVARTSLMLENAQGPLTVNSDPAAPSRAIRAALSALEVGPRRRHDQGALVGSSG